MLRDAAAGFAETVKPFDRGQAPALCESRSLLLADAGSDDPLSDADARVALFGIAVVMSASAVALVVIAPIHRAWLLVRTALRHCWKPPTVEAR